jgi:ankyrin repeat protein
MQESISDVDVSGNTALHYAAENGHEFVTTLVQLGKAVIDIHIRNYEGYTALDLANANNHVWIVSAFKGHAETVKASRALDIRVRGESRVFPAI